MPIIANHDDDLHPHLHSQRTATSVAFMRRAMTFGHLARPLKQLGARGLYVPKPGANARAAAVKAYRSKPSTTQSHLRYLAQGKGMDGADAEIFTMHGRPINQQAFVSRTAQDAHQWRLVLSPEGAERLDLKAYTLAYMAQVEKDLGTRLDYAAAVHYDTAHPHVHIVVAGVDDRRNPLYFTKEYLTNGLRYRAQTLGTDRLGPVAERPLGPRELTPQEGLSTAQVERKMVTATKEAERVRSMTDTSAERMAQRTLTRTQVEARMREANTRAQQIRDLMANSRGAKATTGIER